MVRLKTRLEAVLKSVPYGSAFLDVGCDHAYVAIALVERGICPCGVASDIRPGPLEAAEAHIREAGFADRIVTALSDGVPADAAGCLKRAGWQIGTPVTLITAGMGGRMMADILARADKSLLRCYVASPQRDVPLFRSYLSEAGFRITGESFVEEDGKFYPVIVSERTGEAVRHLTYEEALLGPCLMRSENETYMRFVQKRLKILRGIHAQLPPEEELKRVETAREIEALDHFLKRGGDYVRYG